MQTSIEAVEFYFDRKLTQRETEAVLNNSTQLNVGSREWNILLASDLEKNRKAYAFPSGFVSNPRILQDRIARVLEKPDSAGVWGQIADNLSKPVSKEDNGWIPWSAPKTASWEGVLKTLPTYWPRGFGTFWAAASHAPGDVGELPGFPNLRTIKTAFEDGIGIVFAYENILNRIAKSRREQMDILFRCHGPNALSTIHRHVRRRDAYRFGAEALYSLVRESVTSQQKLLWAHSVDLC